MVEAGVVAELGARRVPATRDRITALVLGVHTTADRPLGFDQVVALCPDDITRDQARTTSAVLCRMDSWSASAPGSTSGPTVYGPPPDQPGQPGHRAHPTCHNGPACRPYGHAAATRPTRPTAPPRALLVSVVGRAVRATVPPRGADDR